MLLTEQLRLLHFLEQMFAELVKDQSRSLVLLHQLVVDAEVQGFKLLDKAPSQFNKYAEIVMVQAKLSGTHACLARARAQHSIQLKKQSIYLRVLIMV
jgi:hypothetical protein